MIPMKAVLESIGIQASAFSTQYLALQHAAAQRCTVDTAALVDQNLSTELRLRLM